ncbi:MAG: PLP-dependent transferase [Chloroflexia bacterium]
MAVTDNTFASSYNQRPLDLGYDLVVHSATKYLNGHADVTAGVVLGDAQLIERAWEHLRVFGPVLHPFESWLLLRGLRTYALRMRGHNANALEVARYLDAHPAVERVYYPGLESHPGHDLARRQMTGGFGAMMAFELRDGYDAARCLVGCTRLCTLAASLGSMESLITHAASMIFPHNSDEERLAAGVTPGLVRLSVGLEDLPDLIADLEQALGRAT